MQRIFLFLFFTNFLFGNSPNFLFSVGLNTDINDYIFPVKIKPNYTSTFGEFRETHLHGGIDISTNHQTGLEVVATRSGYIEKISVSPNGYGKYISVRHEDGFTSFYAHLKKFTDKLDFDILNEQKRNNKYSVEINFSKNDYPVTQGEVIAFSGESGAGGPHLHFEIFDKKGNSINPLFFPKLRNVEDNIFPNFSALAVLPLSQDARIGHNITPQKYLAKRFSSNKFFITDTLHLGGETGFGVEIIDHIFGRDDRLTQYKLTFEIDNKEIVNIERPFHRPNEARQVSLYYEYDLVKEFHNRFQKLFVEKDLTIPFYTANNTSKGIISLNNFSDGFHNFIIKAEDYSGNVSTLNGVFLLTKFPALEIVEVDNDKIMIQIDSVKNVSSIETSFFIPDKKIWIKYLYQIKENNNSIFALPFKENNSSIRKIIAYAKDGSASYPFYSASDLVSNTNLKIEPILYRSNLFLKIISSSPLLQKPSLIIFYKNNSRPIKLYNLSANEFIGKVPHEINSPFEVKCYYQFNGFRIEKSFDIFVRKIEKNISNRFSSSDGGLEINLSQHTLQTEALFNIQNKPDKIYKIEHTAGVFNNGATVKYFLNQKEINNNKFALYSRNGGGWNFVTNEINFETNSFDHRNPRTINSYTILQDNELPIISNLKINPFYKDKSWLFQFSIDDKISGISSSSLDIVLDGKNIFPDYDTEKEKVLYFPLEKIKIGKHKISISVRDNVGNKISFSKTFKLIF